MNVQRAYFPLIKLTFFGVVLLIAKAIFDPTLGQAVVHQFPDYLPLGNASFLSSHRAIAKDRYHYDNDSFHLDGQSYEYRNNSNDSDLTVDLYYVRQANGDIENYFKAYTLDNEIVIAERPTQKQGKNGFYSLFEHKRKAYLSTCINSRGSSTVTREQFVANRNTYDLQPSRLIPVLVGREEPRDARCLWVTLSMPLEHRSVETVQQQLEAAWNDGYRNWLSQFPSL
ncbi:cyanoexosortase A system-associated protein [Myxacorys almedinensis]|uniref:Cyanoexosortase A system-associated protein n=1 Tax=Myxacorys almedinensis A TaxID=2690445 RepID=A0A8J7Z115_9CYAN|nr:cyanoexosortase A system-associated protein [Myxacorys almedinensis]NDJ16201.1 cyanoexosortase A system-associated protein [Myxacorys almedinensis A]